MMKVRQAGLWIAVILSFGLVHAHASTPKLAQTLADHSPIKVIFDTDIWSDIDDAMALAMLNALEDRGEINLLAVTISTNDRWCASYVSLVNTFYHHPDVPIGIVREGMDLEFFRKKFPEVDWPVTRFTQQLSEERQAGGSWTYPNRFSDGSTAADATTLLRKTLAAQPDGSVVMIQAGYSTNLARLLDSPADAVSSMNGRRLVAQKVRLLSLMAGNFGPATFQGKPVPTGSREFNLMADIASAQKLFADWPTPIVASGFEIGLNLLYPPESIEQDYAYVRNHPIAETYRTFCETQKDRSQETTCPHAHPTFDLTSVLYAVRPNRNYFAVSPPGKITVLDDGSSRFVAVPGGRDRYLILQEGQKARTLEAMVMLTTQPPARPR